ncbi:hypothetical protein HK16_09515 [Acetobacter senegalensis]|uniref:Uncharacterized protein n=2 Tax=Acetobacter TaxID=434 RepID=A0A149TTU5_9PROT|nr:hypothetical protein CIW82_04790 [Acetobacter tropicalis]KXV56516.1 hypothetical protein AD948_16615 [Acetobacter senegalensis]OUL66597.1 hypothetical protein HK16_09515 [Acetobacter senegalensis]
MIRLNSLPQHAFPRSTATPRLACVNYGEITASRPDRTGITPFLQNTKKAAGKILRPFHMRICRIPADTIPY